jgi:predicted XRE-type DNA-binding protein
LQTATGVEVYRQADAARKLGVTRGRISQMLRAGELAYVDQEGFRLVTADSLRERERKMKKARAQAKQAG